VVAVAAEVGAELCTEVGAEVGVGGVTASGWRGGRGKGCNELEAGFWACEVWETGKSFRIGAIGALLNLF
jgi:hypothetical protein